MRSLAGFLLLVVAWSVAISAQPQPQPEEERLDGLLEALRAAVDHEPERALVYGTEALQLIGDDETSSRRLEILLDLCKAAYRRERHEQAADYCREAESGARKLGETPILAEALRRKANAIRRLGQHREALGASTEARELYEQIGDRRGWAAASNGIGYAHWRMGDYPKAMDSYVAAHDAFQQAADPGGVAWSLRNIGVLHSDIGEPEKALSLYRQALALQGEVQNQREISSLLSVMGDVQRRLGRLQEALESQLQALKMKEEIGSPTGVAISLGFIGDIYRDQGDPERALDYYRQSLAMRRDIGDRRRESILLIDIAELHQDENRHREALASLEQALAIAGEIDASGEMLRAKRALSVSLGALGRPAESRRALEAHEELSRRMYSEENRAAMEEAQLRFEAAIREQELELLRRQAELDASELRRQRAVMAALVLFMGLSTAIVVVKVRAERQIARQNEQLSAAMKKVSESEDRYRALFEERSTAKLVVACDSGKLLDTNKSGRELVPEGHRPAWLGEILQRLQVSWEDSGDGFVHAFSLGNEPARWMEAWVSPLRLNGRSAAIVLVREVTEMRAVQAQRLAEEQAAHGAGPVSEASGVRDSAIRPLVGPSASLPQGVPEELVFPEGFWIGRSASVLAMYAAMKSLLGTDLSVLIGGETGVGKDRVARILHDSSDRRDGPFVAVNCAAIPAELLESEMFGIGRGVATGVEPRLGQFRSADGGTLFLDEIGEMPLELQAKLLRVVQEKTVHPVGGGEVTVDTWILAATNRDLSELIEAGRFRRDLYYRLAGYVLEVPPLRRRPVDILPLFEHFLRAFAGPDFAVEGFEHRVVEALNSYRWPGNIRELEHEAARTARNLRAAAVVEIGHLSERFDGKKSATETLSSKGLLFGEAEGCWKLKTHVQRLERELILAALEKTGGSRRKVATLLGVSRSTLARKMSDLDL